MHSQEVAWSESWRPSRRLADAELDQEVDDLLHGRKRTNSEEIQKFGDLLREN